VDGDGGPLVGFFTSDEAAYAPLPFTLQPHRSSCWLFKVRASSAAHAVDMTRAVDVSMAAL
jgi:hypothetical protein